MGEAKKRKPLSEKTRKKMSEAKKGRKMTDETKQKISASMKGKNSYKRTGKTREKVSEVKKGKALPEETEKTIRIGDLRLKYKLSYNQMIQCVRSVFCSEYLKRYSLFNELTDEEEEKLIKLLEYKKMKRDRLDEMVKLFRKGELARNLENGLL
jgi:hypothetical protein